MHPISKTTKKRALLVEDDPVLTQLLSDFIQHAGYALTLWPGTMDDISALVRHTDIVVLNLKADSVDGPAIFHSIREASPNLPMIILIAHMEEVGELLTKSQSGTDGTGLMDYMTKPFSPRLIVSRMEAMLDAQRYQDDLQHPQRSWIWFDEPALEIRVRVDRSDQKLTLTLTPVEYKLIQHLVSHPYRIFSREQLMRFVYSDQRFVDESVIDRHLSNLAAKLSKAYPHTTLISSIGGIGYRFEQP